jgi:MerR family transcriptional regulator, thiopeptide resistance regulator
MTTAKDAPASTAPAVIPIIVYQDIEAAHDYLVKVFGFAPGGIHRDGDGLVVHGEVRMGDSPIWLHRVTAEHEMNSPKDASESHGGLEVIVPDVDAHFARARAAGAHIDRPPADQEYGLREYGARDLENHRWWFSSPIGSPTLR